MQTKTRAALAVAAGIAVFGIVGASAASLGGLSSPGVGSADDAIESCDTNGATLSYTRTFNGLTGKFDVNGVTVGGLASACNGRAISVVLKNSETGAATATATFDGTVSAPGETSLTGDSMTAEDVRGVAVIVTG